MEEINAPFTEEQVFNLNVYQKIGTFHPFTGLGLDEQGNPNYKNGSRSRCPDGECLLIATTDGWVCPCRKYTQNWAYKFMAEQPQQDWIADRLKKL